MNTQTNETEHTAPTKAQLIAELYRFAAQRPGLDFRNYCSGWQDAAGGQAYASEVRSIGRDLGHARQLIRAVELRDSITAEDILKELSNRLTWDAKRDCLDYCAGQYWCTEYRPAVCRAMASVLWGWIRNTSMPKPTLHHNTETGESVERFDGWRAGDWLRRRFRREFGRGIASRWFN